MILYKLTKDNLDVLDSIAAIFDQYRMFYDQNSDLNGAKKFLYDRIINNESQIFFVKDAQKVIGFMQIYQSFSSVGMRKICILNDLYVDKDFRKRGVARALIKEAQRFCSEQNITKITLTTAKTNKQAQGLYKSEGYKKEEEFFVYDLELHSA